MKQGEHHEPQLQDPNPITDIIRRVGIDCNVHQVVGYRDLGNQSYRHRNRNLEPDDSSERRGVNGAAPTATSRDYKENR